MRSLHRLLGALAIVVLAAGALPGCSGGDGSGSPPPPPPPSPGTWGWIPLAGTECSDGSSTGIGVNVGPGASPNVLVFLNGGGACWDYVTCAAGAATPGPFGQAQFDAEVASFAGSILDRTLAGNPFKDFTFVFVPYCTGDVHTGNTVQTYVSPLPGGATVVWHHKGRVNLHEGFAYLGANLAAPAKVVVSGSSAGGFGSLYAFDVARTTWPAAKGYLVDDSGPPIQGIPQTTVDAWYSSWDMGGAITPLCGTGCQTNLSLVFPALQAKYPADRLALLSSWDDAVIRSFFGTFSSTPPYVVPMVTTTFEADLRALAIDLIGSASVPNGHSFLVPGPTHTMLGTPAAFTSQGVALTEWLRQEVEDDGAWATLAPPP